MSALQRRESPADTGQTQDQNTLERASIIGEQQSDSKRFSTLAARFALTGHGLVKSQPGEGTAPYYCTRWGLIKPLVSLDAAELFLMQVGGAA